MRRAILMVMLAVVSNSATAKWVEVAGNDRYTSYADPATIRKVGNKVKMWDLNDFKTRQAWKPGEGTGPYMSSKSLFEYDCKEEQMRMLSLSRHAENMSGGEVVASTDDPSNWSAVSPGSVGESLWKFACGKK